MKIIDRMGTLLRANLNSLVERAEDPEKILNQIILDMEDHFRVTKKSVAIAIAGHKQLERKTRQLEEIAQGWEKKAMMAARAGRDDLSLEALRRKQEQDELAAHHRSQLEVSQTTTEELKRTLRKLDTKLDQARRKRAVLITRQRQVEAARRIEAIREQISETSATSQLAAMEERILASEAEVEAMRELSGSGQAALEDDFQALQADQSARAALEALKAKIGITPQTTSSSADFVFEEEEEVVAITNHRMSQGR